MKTTTPFQNSINHCSLFLVRLVLACFALFQSAQAVSPPPDGGYPGGNTAEGQNALLNLTTGMYNTAVGLFSLESNVTGNLNTAIGAGTLSANTADNNTATGAGALLNNTTGSFNTAAGVFALFDNTTGGSNTANGFAALGNNTTGSFNTANGVNTLINNTTGANNTATGYQTLSNNTTAFGNTATGYRGLTSNTNGAGNTANGAGALQNNTTGGANTAIGSAALFNNTTGDSNTALGNSAGFGVTTASSVICIGTFGANVSNTTWIGNVYGVTTQNGTTAPVIVSADGQLGTVASSERFKKDITSMAKASETIFSFRPVSFHYRSDARETPQFGLIAEEVAKVDPALVLPDKEGKPYTVRYEAVNAMLLNEFLKTHRRMEEQEATIARQQQQIEALTENLQKVSAQIEVSKAASQTVLTNH